MTSNVQQLGEVVGSIADLRTDRDTARERVRAAGVLATCIVEHVMRLAAKLDGPVLDDRDLVASLAAVRVLADAIIAVTADQKGTT